MGVGGRVNRVHFEKGREDQEGLGDRQAALRELDRGGGRCKVLTESAVHLLEEREIGEDCVVHIRGHQLAQPAKDEGPIEHPNRQPSVAESIAWDPLRGLTRAVGLDPADARQDEARAHEAHVTEVGRLRREELVEHLAQVLLVFP